MSRPIEFEFVAEDGRRLVGHADAFTRGDPSVGIFGPYYEEVWAEDEKGQQVQLSDVDSDRLFEQACHIADEPDEDDYL